MDSDEFVFGTFAQLLKDAWRGRVSQVAIARLLYEAVTDSLPLVSYDIGTIGTKTASKLFRRKLDVHNDVVSHKSDKSVLEGISTHFEDNVISKLEDSRIPNLIKGLVSLIESSTRPQPVKERLVELSCGAPLHVFLAEAYLECLARRNKLAKTDISEDVSRTASIPPCPDDGFSSIEVPSEITQQESRYVHALLEAYCDAEGESEVDIAFLDEQPAYARHFSRQRNDFFNADFVRHSIRGASQEGEEGLFKELEREIHDGIIDVYERRYVNGYERLVECLIQAPKIEVARSWINADPGWLSVSVKKGVCHILVNDEILDGWIR